MQNDLDPQNDCPCCSGAKFQDCCQPLITRGKIAPTPLALMRSRYTAHIAKNIKYIIDTMRGKALKLFDQEATETEWFDRTQWQKLEIIEAVDNIVEFRAHYVLDNNARILHERSKFEKIDGRWYYVAGQHKNAEIRVSDKVGRNDACTCGSGKKYKKCCA